MDNVTECDLLIVGGGPAGLSAAINGASEGLNVVLMDSGPELGGQARRSSLIENYAGFPEGISGQELLNKFVDQASKFHTEILCPQRAAALRADGDRRLVVSDDEQIYSARAVILSLGLSYRRLAAPGLGAMLGRGALYGTPSIDPLALGQCVISIVGGANSAGQAAMDLARNKQIRIRMLIRRRIEDQMSTYLLERIREMVNIEIVEGVEVVEVLGDQKLRAIKVKKGESVETIDTDHMFIFIGAQPKTMWLNGSVALDARKYVVTGSANLKSGIWTLERPPLSFETSMPGVFACGDVRLGSIKRVAAAVGEGAGALAACHEYFRLTGSGENK